MKIGIDLDNTINTSAATVGLFSLLTHALKGKAEIHIITNRDNSEEGKSRTINELAECGIYYDKLIITANKHDYIIDNNINVYVDDTDETFITLPSSVIVLKIREPGNFDFDHHKWIYGNKTGINIDDNK